MMANDRYGLLEVALSFLAGCVVGGTAALLYAPQSGTRTRRRIADFAEDVRDRTGDVTERASEKIQKAKEQATEKVQKAIERGRNLVDV
ncbi:MAG: YtxH domain-containing protein [Nitrospira sp.]|nr:YtxH domain-containing protein [Nitrospira sp.]MBX3332919.1 YtxH domain-containing protein [Nitrospira sp.]MDR4466624.1 YtxH domain-containing protein [Nitrospira sp.]